MTLRIIGSYGRYIALCGTTTHYTHTPLFIVLTHLHIFIYPTDYMED